MLHSLCFCSCLLESRSGTVRGLVRHRVLVWNPVPHVLLHSDHVPQFDQTSRIRETDAVTVACLDTWPVANVVEGTDMDSLAKDVSKALDSKIVKCVSCSDDAGIGTDGVLFITVRIEVSDKINNKLSASLLMRLLMMLPRALSACWASTCARYWGNCWAKQCSTSGHSTKLAREPL